MSSRPSSTLEQAPLAMHIRRHLFFSQAKSAALATTHDHYRALALAVRDRLLENWVDTADTYMAQGVRTAAYLSAEYLLGPHLENNLVNLGMREEAEQACRELGLDLQELIATEPEPGLGNGGLGRLAACFQESLASLELPAIGYGIRYEFGIFHQRIGSDGQHESTDPWLTKGNPWEVIRPEWSYPVRIGEHTVMGVAYDTPIVGYGVRTANTLRLWSAMAQEAFDFASFNAGDYTRAVLAKVRSETLSKVLYPNDELDQGKALRLSQQIFFVSCSLQDMLRILKGQGLAVTDFHRKFAVQLNDTHPAIAVAELMRLLIDGEGVSWDTAWTITTSSLSYTNHTLLPEALETWGVALFEHLLPRHLELIYEINARFLQVVRLRHPGKPDLLRRMSLIEEGEHRRVRMAHLAVVGSQRTNGVAELHSQLLRDHVLRDFAELWPERFTNVTNGVTPRRWIAVANPGLASLLDEVLGGDRWRRHLEDLAGLEPLLDDGAFLERWQQMRHQAKLRLAHHIQRDTGVLVDPGSLFDVQVKRIHEYKRQHLAALEVVQRYLRLRNGEDLPPRTVIFGGKAAPGYAMAKLIIRLIVSIADTVNMDPAIGGRLRVVYLPNFSVRVGQLVYPAVDLSEQISTAGKEASGTGNMKMALNGALTIGTLDGANVEIRERVGDDNFFLFGHNAEEVSAMAAAGYHPMPWLEGNDSLRAAIELIGTGHFSEGNRELFPLLASLTSHDPYQVVADAADYSRAQNAVDQAWRNPSGWARSSAINTMRCGFFSSDRSILDYAERIWNLQPVPVPPSR
ncbi:MAG: glycogen/starch/alpha-glucan phosphorylase [Cyanobacteriota bacterium]